MRALLLLAVIGLSACKWTEFDDISKATWAHSVSKPDEVGSTDYAIAIAGATGSGGTGGVLGVVSNIPPTYSSIDYDPSGSTVIGPNRLHLLDFAITSLPQQPILVAAADGTVALVNAGTAANTLSVVTGPGDNPAHQVITTAMSSSPDAAAFAGTHLVTAADQLYLDVDASGTHATGCAMPERAAALAATDTQVFEWSQQGNFITYAVPSPFGCPTAAPTPTATGFMPGPGAQIHLAGNLAVLAGHGPQTTASMALVIDTTTGQAIGTPLSLDGLGSSAVLDVGGTMYVALGFPDRSVNGVTSGQVELHVLDQAMGIHADVAETLSDAQPQTGQKFGRALTTMTFNGSEILVVGADSEVFAYYRTLLYADTRQ